METQEKVDLIKKLVDYHKRFDENYLSIEKIFGTYPEGKFWNNTWGLFDMAVGLVEEAIGDDGDWINWYLWERSDRTDLVTYGDPVIEVHVDSVEKLVQVIEGK